MANALYDHGRDGFLNKEIGWKTDDIRVILVDTDQYTPDLANHKFLSSVPAGSRIATGQVESRTSVAGIADGADVTFASVTGPESEALVLYQHTGNDATSRLIAYMDDVDKLPVLPNGGDITIKWDDGANKIFKL